MTTETLAKQIQVASKKVKAPLVIKNAKIVNVYSHKIVEGDIAICDGVIAGIGSYDGESEVDAAGLYAIPGLIDSHIHIESSFTTPEEFGKMVVPFGTTTVIADPHEITNVCGLEGLDYMIEAAKNTALDIQYMVPSCVPATPFENAGATITAAQIESIIHNPAVLGLGEMMNYPGVLGCDEEVLKKITLFRNMNKVIDGHAPGLFGYDRQAYISTGIKTDHECSTLEEMNQSIDNGMYVELRDGSACHDLINLIPGITTENSRRLLLCSDDRQPVTFFNTGSINNHLRICVQNGIDAITAIQMGSLNAAECYKLRDRGAIAAGLRADIALMDNLKDFNAKKVFVGGELVAENGKYLKEVKRVPIDKVSGTVHLKDFSADRLKIQLDKARNSIKDNVATVHAIEIAAGSIVTKNKITQVHVNDKNEFVFDPQIDVVKIAVIERHHNTGNVGLGLLSNYGIKAGAVALTIAHDSHNIICCGTNDADMVFAVEKLKDQNGGVVLVKEGKVISAMELPVAGLMSDKDGKWVQEHLGQLREIAYKELGVNPEIAPVATLCFMALPVIPELKITDKGLFDVTKFEFTQI